MTIGGAGPWIRRQTADSGSARRWVQLWNSGEATTGDFVDFPPWDNIDGDPALLNTTTLDSGELGPDAIPIGVAYQHPMDAEAQYVDFRGTVEVNNGVSDGDLCALQVALLKNDTDTFGGGSSQFAQDRFSNGASDTVTISTSIQKRIFLNPGDYVVMLTDTQLGTDPLFSTNCVFIAEMAGNGGSFAS